VRLQNLEEMVTQLARQGEMVAQLARQGSHGGEPRPAVVRVSVKSDCILEFIPEQQSRAAEQSKGQRRAEQLSEYVASYVDEFSRRVIERD
jgi:hypothetical protein